MVSADSAVTSELGGLYISMVDVLMVFAGRPEPRTIWPSQHYATEATSAVNCKQVLQI